MNDGAPARTETGSTLSSDGTRIGWRRLGTGPVVVIVHGSLMTGEHWLGVGRALAEDHTVVLVDRRGRGLSGDAAAYGLPLEAADLTAVLAAVGPGAALVGHSYGAVCAAAAAAAGADVSALVLNEPPLPVDGRLPESPFVRIAAALAAGDHDEALSVILAEVLRVPDPTGAALRASPAWAAMAALAGTFEREIRATNGLLGDLGALAGIPQRTLLLLGGRSTPVATGATRFLAGRLPDVSVTEFPEADHFLFATDPARVAEAIRGFVRRP